MKKVAYINSRHALVAGGAGFVGSHLCTRLLDMGYGKVTCLDNLSTGRLSNIEDLMDNPGFVFIQVDVTEWIGIGEEISEIYNLACPASPEQYRKNPVGTFKASVIGSINLLELAKDRKARILLASTSEVYGDPQIPVQDESYHGNVNPYGTRSFYDEGKRGAETFFHDYHLTLGVDTRIIRIFNTYGPHMSTDDGRVVSNYRSGAPERAVDNLWRRLSDEVFPIHLRPYRRNDRYHERTGLVKEMSDSLHSEEVEAEMERHMRWRDMTRLSSTPAVLVNGYILPKEYDIMDLAMIVDL